MDEIRFDRHAYDPAYVNAMLREARRMRNEALVDLVKALLDGRLAARLFGAEADRHEGLPRGSQLQG
jgi:hypothetical protein